MMWSFFVFRYIQLPLDTGCFGPLKEYWSEACCNFTFANPGCVVSKFHFSSLFSQAWSKGMTISNIVSGFCSTGIYPLNCNVVLSKLPTSVESCILFSGSEQSAGSDHELSNEEAIDSEASASDHPVPVTYPAEPEDPHTQNHSDFPNFAQTN